MAVSCYICFSSFDLLFLVISSCLVMAVQFSLLWSESQSKKIINFNILPPLFLFNCSLFLRSIADILSSGLTSYIYLIILVSFFCSLITSVFNLSSLTYNITLCVHSVDNLSFNSKDKPVLVIKGNIVPTR